jgi:receptor-interacting serine/threonine-protein kinase 5
VFRNLPEHERIVALRGSIIDTAYGSNRCELAVMLIMDRYSRDLFTAIKCGLDFGSRCVTF